MRMFALSVALLFALSSCASAPAPAEEPLISTTQTLKQTKPVVTMEEIEKVEFGARVNVMGKVMYGTQVEIDGEQVLGPDQIVRQTEGLPYGWRMHIKPEHLKQMKVTEVLRLPEPGEWNVSNRTRISRDKRTATTTYTTYPDKDNTISNEWTLTEEDPVGRYSIKLYVEDQHVATHVFEVK